MTALDPARRYWDERLETLAPERRRLLREHRLHWQLRRCWDGSPFYRARFEAAGLDPSTFGGSSDWHRFPPVHGDDLPPGRIRSPATSWTVAPAEWSRSIKQLSSRPRRVRTDGDEIHQADLVARALWAGGIRPLYGLGSFDCFAVESTDYSTVIVSGAGRIETLASGIRNDPEVNPRACWTEVWPLSAGEKAPPAVALGATFGTPTLAFTCQDDGVLHWLDDHFLVETVDLATGEPVAAGEVGAVVITDLTREGSPLLRYWTGLEAALSDEPCPCRRTSVHSAFVRRSK